GDEDDEGRPERGGLADSAAVVLDGFGESRRGFRGEKSTPAERDDGEIPGAEFLADFCDVTTFESLTPDGDATDASFGVFVHRHFDGPGLGRDGVDAEAGKVHWE